MGGGRLLQGQQGTRRTRVGIGEHARHQVGEHPDAVARRGIATVPPAPSGLAGPGPAGIAAISLLASSKRPARAR
jgi:hypothetical protein